jgi:hypothetical protein
MARLRINERHEWMSDDVVIKLNADVSDLQRGLQQATTSMESTLSILQAGAAGLGSSFASASRASENAAAQQISSAQSSTAAELVIARQAEAIRYNIAANGVREEVSLVRQRAQTGLISRQEGLSNVLDLSRQQEQIERNHYQFLAGTYRQDTAAYAAAQAKMSEITNESARRRQEIERVVTTEIQQDYRRAFGQIGDSVSRSITGIIAGTTSFRDAARNILLQIIQTFIQGRVRMVTDWLAGVAAQTAATSAGEAAKTSAVAAGTAARTGLESTASATSGISIIGNVLKSIFASAAQTFAGIFGFLSPVMGPAAAGPALAGQATVLGVASALPSFDIGTWELPSDMIAKVHKGEMIVPAGPAAAWRGQLDGGPIGGGAGGGNVTVNQGTTLNVSAIDATSVRRLFKNNSRQIMRTINEGVRTGAHLGLSQLDKS